MNKILSRKAQVWVTDFTLSVLLFTIAALASFAILINTFDTSTRFKSTTDDATRIGNYLLSDGVPASWNQTNAVRPGILSYGRINSSKLVMAMQMSNTSYENLKTMMQTQNDFIITFENKTGNILTFSNYCVIGNPEDAVQKYLNVTMQCLNADFSSMSYDNLAKITRFTVYQGQIVKMNIYVWN